VTPAVNERVWWGARSRQIDVERTNGHLSEVGFSYL